MDRIDNDTIDIPTRIRLAMTALGLNQSDLADQMGVTRASVSSWLNRDADRRTAMSSSALEKMAGVLRVNRDWIVGDSKDGGPDMDLLLEEELKHELEYLPTHELFLKEVRNIINEEEDDPFLSAGFNDCSLGYMGSSYDSNSITYDYINERIILNVDIVRKAHRNLESLTELAWPLFMAKRIDEINGRPTRRYQLMLINPPLLNRDVYDKFSHESAMMGVQVSIRDKADAKEIANLIADPNFKDGIDRWPESFVASIGFLRNE
jgi:transcriptional regulator with XRE-family HTH domain|tara:strand:+ start:786 stop:1577 length:792 start_codon:yes stop_codon:yes gene_type:complete